MKIVSKQSKRFRVNKYDWLKSIIMAFGAAFLTSLLPVLNGSGFPSNWEQWKPTVLVSTITTITYILKQFFTGDKQPFIK